MSVCVSVALSTRVGGIKRERKKKKQPNLKAEKKQEIHSLHFRAPRGFDGLSWQILASP